MATTSKPKEGGQSSASDSSPYSMRNLFLLMPYLPLTDAKAIDYDAADSALLVQIADTAEITILMAHISMSAIGQVLSRLSLFGSTDEVATETIETLGLLLAELGDFTSVVFTIVMACRAHTFDYAPGVIEVISLVKP